MPDEEVVIPFDFGTSRQHTVKQRTAMQHEVVRLLDDLVPTKGPARRGAPGRAVQAYRWPNRCILQGRSRAVSLTWFPGGRGDTSLGELLVITWRGTVSLPGLGRGKGEEAVALAQLLLHLEATAPGTWEWRAGRDAVAGLATAALAGYCRDQVAVVDGAAAGGVLDVV